MSVVIDRQTFIFSVNMSIIDTISTPMNLRFAADELILKSISYNVAPGVDTPTVVQIWCNITNDNLIGTFPNNTAVFQHHDEHFRISNSFQTGIFQLQFQETDNNLSSSSICYNPQPLIGASAKGVVSITIEFVKYAK